MSSGYLTDLHIEDDFIDLLADAEANAKTDWERKFVADLNERWERYGGDMFLSEKQSETLERISRGDAYPEED